MHLETEVAKKINKVYNIHFIKYNTCSQQIPHKYILFIIYFICHPLMFIVNLSPECFTEYLRFQIHILQNLIKSV